MGARAGDDGGGSGVADAPVSPTADAPPGTPDAPPGTPDAKPQGPPDASPYSGVGCGNMMCSAPNVCCVGGGGIGGGPMTFECKDKCDGDQGTFACDGPEDCPGQHCCVSRSGSSCSDDCGFDSTACRLKSDCGGNDDCCKTQYPSLNLCGFVCF